VCPWRAYGGVEVYVHPFLTEALCYGHFAPTERTLVPLGTGGCVGPGAGLDFFGGKAFCPCRVWKKYSSVVYPIAWSV